MDYSNGLERCVVAVVRIVIPRCCYYVVDLIALIALVDLLDVPLLAILSMILTALDRLALQNYSVIFITTYSSQNIIFIKSKTKSNQIRTWIFIE